MYYFWHVFLKILNSLKSFCSRKKIPSVFSPQKTKRKKKEGKTIGTPSLFPPSKDEKGKRFFVFRLT